MGRTIRGGAVVVLFAAVGLAAGEGPVGWRGDGTGRFPDAAPPTRWDTDTNVLWKVALPGASFAAPISVGDNLFVVSDPAEVLCVRRTDGKVLWKESLGDVKGAAGGKGGKGGMRGKGGGKGGKGGGGGGLGGRSAGNTAATPASDGKHVAVVLGNGVVAVYTPDGKRLWARAIEAGQGSFGHSASPLLIGHKVIVHLSDLVALDVTTGKEAWRAKLSPSHASPVAAKVGQQDVVIDPSGAVVRARDGAVLAKGQFRTSHSSPVVVGDSVCVFGGSGLQCYKLAPGKDDEVTVTSLWTAKVASDQRRLPSSVAHDGLFYAVTTEGMLDVVDMKTGERAYRQRLPTGQLYASLAVAGGHVFAFDTRGKSVVFKAGRKYEAVATNSLEATGSCPVFAGDHLYVRGQRNLYCLSAKAADKQGG